LVSSIASAADRRILTNWGSDIYYFQHKPEHIERIRRSLEWASDYSAECERDYKLAKDFGFVGRNLPRIPNAGGFLQDANQVRCSQRDLILVKTYGGEFGAGRTAIGSVRLFLEEHQNFKVFFYSVTQDLLSLIQSLKEDYPTLVNYSTLENSIPHEDLMELFREARVYLGCSYSDGLSTSFLQALCSGAYPIQTNTSCAGELISDGAAGGVISLDQKVILSELKQIIFDEDRLDLAQELNAKYSKLKLDAGKIARIAKSYYLA
jgi:glycosyltransferase involved in cell wall biosynthesis